MKVCRICGESKPYEDFYRATGMRDGYRSECKRCQLAAHKRRHAANPEPARARARRWNRDNPQRVKQRMEEYRRSGKKSVSDRASYLKRKFGMTQADYESMLAAQGGGCAICGRLPRDDISLHVDHDHVTGRIRALCCFPCNNAIGLLYEDPELAFAVGEYLIEHQAELALERARSLVAGRG
jgi:hypothetical protein